jgi:hypothetical protein
MSAARPFYWPQQQQTCWHRPPLNGHGTVLVDEALKNVRLELHAEKIKCTSMLTSHYPKGGQDRDTEIANRSYENVAQFGYLETRVINKNFLQGKIKKKLNSGNACYRSVQNLFSSRLLSNDVNFRIHFF